MDMDIDEYQFVNSTRFDIAFGYWSDGFYPDFLTKEEQEIFDRFIKNIDDDIL